jgi:prepilin-type N-terminal cleavage/methylation domain-containing protein
MAQKYTILKAITQSLSKLDKSNKGFTLIELIVGMSIMLIVGGLAMNALVQSSSSFNKDKQRIDSSQSMSAILEMIGNDIKQSGENISDNNFPTIEFNIADATLDPTLKPGSSKIIVRRALLSPLALCDSAFTSTSTVITVADNDPAVTSTTNGANCDVATSSSQLSVYRVTPPPVLPVTVPPTVVPTTYYPPTTITNPYPLTTDATPPLLLKLPLALRKLRDYRCELDNLNPTTGYNDAANAGTDFCDGVSSEKSRIAVSNSSGQFLFFNQTGEIVPTTNTADTVAATGTVSTKKYQIAVNTNFTRVDAADTTVDPAIANNAKNGVSTVMYPIGSPIYVIEERIYTLSTNGNLQLSVNGAAPKTLVKKIEKFIVSAKTYSNSTDRIINPKPAGSTVNPVTTSTTALTTTNPICYSPVTPVAAVTNPQAADATETNPQYICKFNYFTGVAVADKADWKTLAGIKVEIQTKYDGTGQEAEATDPLLDSAQVKESKKKLYAASEFFPRNVLSK